MPCVLADRPQRLSAVKTWPGQVGDVVIGGVLDRGGQQRAGARSLLATNPNLNPVAANETLLNPVSQLV